ncbi:MAG: hypothetical protein K2X03_28810 [Bryobacteraceae bacterium]|nr:hypothetical protein [Bryobacteraceae bacterium]
MNSTFLVLCAALQVAILAAQAPWRDGLLFAVPLLAIVSLFAYTRQYWPAHLDMYLLMAAPGGLGMMAALLLPGPVCHRGAGWDGYAAMSAGMLFCSLPLAWRSARCLQQARSEGLGVLALLFDALGMQAGMALAHLPLTRLSLMDPRSIWLHHGLMIVGMLLGMSVSMVAFRYRGGFGKAWTSHAAAPRTLVGRRNSLPS